MNSSDIKNNLNKLAPLIDNAILDAVVWINGECRKAAGEAPQEPDYMAALTVRFVEKLHYILGGVFTDHEFAVSGVYCHQRPVVDYKNSPNGRGPELADLLLVYIDRDDPGNVRFNSLMLQAKRFSGSSLRIGANDRHQLELYKRWPLFTYRTPAVLKGQARDIRPKAVNAGAQYLLINDEAITRKLNSSRGDVPNNLMSCAVPADTLHVHGNFTSALVKLLDFSSGCAFVDQKYPGPVDDWSKMIWDLLMAANGIYSRRSNAGLTGLRKFARGVDYGVSFQTAGMVKGPWFGEDADPGPLGNSQYGVPVIMIESSRSAESYPLFDEFSLWEPGR